jgi:hypothetical protein
MRTGIVTLGAGLGLVQKRAAAQPERTWRPGKSGTLHTEGTDDRADALAAAGVSSTPEASPTRARVRKGATAWTA